MPAIVIDNLEKKTLPVQDFSKTVLRHLQENQVDWMYACGGKGRCTTCAFQVIDGMDNLTPITQAESKYLAMGALRKDHRLACQTKITGAVVIRVPEENQLPHLTYSD